MLGSDQTKVVGIDPKNLIKLAFKVFIPNVFKHIIVHFQGNLNYITKNCMSVNTQEYGYILG